MITILMNGGSFACDRRVNISGAFLLAAVSIAANTTEWIRPVQGLAAPFAPVDPRFIRAGSSSARCRCSRADAVDTGESKHILMRFANGG